MQKWGWLAARCLRHCRILQTHQQTQNTRCVHSRRAPCELTLTCYPAKTAKYTLPAERIHNSQTISAVSYHHGQICVEAWKTPFHILNVSFIREQPRMSGRNATEDDLMKSLSVSRSEVIRLFNRRWKWRDGCEDEEEDDGCLRTKRQKQRGIFSFRLNLDSWMKK